MIRRDGRRTPRRILVESLHRQGSGNVELKFWKSAEQSSNEKTKRQSLLDVSRPPETPLISSKLRPTTSFSSFVTEPEEQPSPRQVTKNIKILKASIDLASCLTMVQLNNKYQRASIDESSRTLGQVRARSIMSNASPQLAQSSKEWREPLNQQAVQTVVSLKQHIADYQKGSPQMRQRGEHPKGLYSDTLHPLESAFSEHRSWDFSPTELQRPASPHPRLSGNLIASARERIIEKPTDDSMMPKISLVCMDNGSEKTSDDKGTRTLPPSRLVLGSTVVKGSNVSNSRLRSLVEYQSLSTRSMQSPHNTHLHAETEIDLELKNRITSVGRAIDHEEKPPAAEKRISIPNKSAMVENLRQEEALRRADPEWKKLARIIFDCSQSQSGLNAVVSSNTPTFSSNFESGNLKKVMQVGPYEFDLHLSADTDTQRHMQWYYFKVSGLEVNVSYKFNIVNLCKRDSLYNHGLRPLTYSKMRVDTVGIGWARSCEKIAYFPSLVHHRRNSRTPFHTLTFTYQAEFDGDTVFFAHCYPYTTKQLRQDLNNIEKDPERKKHFRKSVLCSTVGGLPCYLIEINSESKGPDSSRREDVPAAPEKKGIFITARVHPGETPASYIMRGILKFLTSNEPEAKLLRERFVFKLIPMMNPDGVVSGNTRCTLQGDDLNRHWRSPDEIKHSTLCAAKQFLQRFSRERKVCLNLDLHAHSRRCNIFAYGCPANSKPVALSEDIVPNDFERVFPSILSQMCEAFHYGYCSFRTKGKEETARVVVNSEFHVPASYTIEASFLGGDFGAFNEMHYTSEDYSNFGRSICLAILEYSNASMIEEHLALVRSHKIKCAAEDDELSSEVSDFSSEEDEPLPTEIISETPRSHHKDIASISRKSETQRAHRSSHGGISNKDSKEKSGRKKRDESERNSPHRAIPSRRSKARGGSKASAASVDVHVQDDLDKPDDTEIQEPAQEEPDVLERVRAIKAQMAGMAQEFSELEHRVTKYDGYLKNIIDNM